MAASRIKGITIEIGGDTTKLQTALRSFTFTDGWEIDELVKREYTDSKSGRSGIGGFAMPVDVNGSNV